MNHRSFADISRYSYSPDELEANVRPGDPRLFGMPAGGLITALPKYSADFFKSKGEISSMTKTKLHGKYIYPLLTLKDHLYVRRTDQILRKALKISRPDRNNEIRQLLTILETEPNYNILRIDIQSFFESVEFEQVINRLETEGFRNRSTIDHLRGINHHLRSRHAYQGLPRGLAISSTLADYILQNIDQTLSARSSTIYYTRYVDDVCIVHIAENKQLCSEIAMWLREVGLKLNSSKTLMLDQDSKDALTFLGYSIRLSNPVAVSIAPSKIAKAKRRIAQTLQAFATSTSSTAFIDFRDRLRLLSSVVELSKIDRLTPVFSGFRHVYNACTPKEIEAQLSELDAFLQGIINSRRYKLGRLVRTRMTAAQHAQIVKISFRSGYTRKIVARFRPDRISDLKEAWRYE
jgi:hypothetical protein